MIKHESDKTYAECSNYLISCISPGPSPKGREETFPFLSLALRFFLRSSILDRMVFGRSQPVYEFTYAREQKLV